MKKTLFFAVVLALLVGLLPSGMLFAEETAETTQEFKLADVSAAPGAEVRVPVVLERNDGLISLKLSLDYDKDILTLDDAKVPEGEKLKGWQGVGNQDKVPGFLQYWNDGGALENNTYTGTIVTYIFKVNENAKIGATSKVEISLVAGSAVIPNEPNDVATLVADPASATVTVAKAETTASTTEPTTEPKTEPSTEPSTEPKTDSSTEPKTESKTDPSATKTKPADENPPTSSTSDVFAITGIAAVLAAAAVVAKKKF